MDYELKLTKENFLGEWLKALRSGDYQKGQGALRTSNGKYCCLGVLCEIAGVPREDRQNESSRYDVTDHGSNYSTSYMPDRIADYFGIRIALNFKNLVMLDGGKFENIAEINDSTLGYSFEQIANIIEAQFAADNIESA